MLEKKLQSELNGSGASGSENGVRCCLVGCFAATQNLSGRIVECGHARIRENRVIQNVEEFGAELSSKPFFYLPILEQRKIPIAEARIASAEPFFAQVRVRRASN